jgi:hypothetical protein
MPLNVWSKYQEVIIKVVREDRGGEERGVEANRASSLLEISGVVVLYRQWKVFWGKKHFV